jgi:nucleotide-binding universal stress UspA family protein
LARARQSLVDAVIDEARSRLPDHLRGTAQSTSDTIDARHGIVAAAEKHAAKLIVVGARGLGTLERLLVGSVSRAVVHASKVPVWVNRSVSGRDVRAGTGILVACENPHLGAPLVDAINALAWPEGSTCRTLTIVPSMFAGKVPDWLQQQARSPDVEAMVQAWAREHDQELRSMQAQMNEFAARLPVRCRHSEPIVAEGEPARVILSTIAREKIDVVVVGAHRKNWLTSALLGSTSEAVLNHAPCSVLVVPLVAEKK